MENTNTSLHTQHCKGQHQVAPTRKYGKCLLWYDTKQQLSNKNEKEINKKKFAIFICTNISDSIKITFACNFVIK